MRIADQAFHDYPMANRSAHYSLLDKTFSNLKLVVDMTPAAKKRPLLSKGH